jgi:hypothetical protein
VNLAIFDELVALFQRSAPIPASGHHSHRYPDLHSYDFPAFLDLGTNAAFAERVSAIRRDIIEKRKEFVANAAVTFRLPRLAKSRESWLHSVGIGVVSCVRKILCGRRIFADSARRCAYPL